MRIGFIGVGTMGGRMASSLRIAGHEMYVNDVRPEAVAPQRGRRRHRKATAREIGAASEVVFTSLPGPAEFTDVTIGANGLLHGMARGSGAVRPDDEFADDDPRRACDVHGSTGCTCSTRRSAAGRRAPRRARSRIWVGGDESIYRPATRRCCATSAISRRISGRSASHRSAKLVHNCAGYAIQAALAEVFTMGVKGGVDPLVLWRVVRQGFVGRARVFDRLADQFLPSSLRSAELHAPHWRTRTCRWRPRLAASWTCRCGSGEPGARGIDRGRQPRMERARLAGRDAAAGRAGGRRDKGVA